MLHSSTAAMVHQGFAFLASSTREHIWVDSLGWHVMSRSHDILVAPLTDVGDQEAIAGHYHGKDEIEVSKLVLEIPNDRCLD